MGNPFFNVPHGHLSTVVDWGKIIAYQGADEAPWTIGVTNPPDSKRVTFFISSYADGGEIFDRFHLVSLYPFNGGLAYTHDNGASYTIHNLPGGHITKGQTITVADGVTYTAKYDCYMAIVMLRWGQVADMSMPHYVYEETGLNAAVQYLGADPYDPGDNSGIGGGTGDVDNTSDTIDFSDPPTLSAVSTGMITLFSPSISQLNDLASYMWSNPLFDLSQWKKIFADPMDAILGLSIIPVTPTTGGLATLKVGNISTSVTMNKVINQYVTVDCGTLNVNEYWGAYLDYEPFTKAEIYLPYCGTHAISVDDIMGKSVQVKYIIDVLSGACCAELKCGGSVLYTFIGHCASSIPVSGGDWSTMMNGVISAAVAVGSMVATGGALAPTAIPALTSTAVNGLKPAIEKSGAMGGTGGMLAVQKPYLILTRPRQAKPKDQNKYLGYPSFVTMKLGDIGGYTEVASIHLEGIPATDDELNELDRLLKEGVIL